MPELAGYLGAPGAVPQIGPEKGRAKREGIAKFTSPHGSYRYVLFMGGDPISVVQVVSSDGKHATIANAFTRPDHRRMGHADQLLRRARRDFKSVKHAAESHLSEDARAWRSASNPPGPTMSPQRIYPGGKMYQVHHPDGVRGRFETRREAERWAAAQPGPTRIVAYPRGLPQEARLERYGEVFRDSLNVQGSVVTIVVRGIFQQRKGDSFHARVLRGGGAPAEEKGRNILWKDDFYIHTYGASPDYAVQAARNWIASPAGQKKIRGRSSLAAQKKRLRSINAELLELGNRGDQTSIRRRKALSEERRVLLDTADSDELYAIHDAFSLRRHRAEQKAALATWSTPPGEIKAARKKARGKAPATIRVTPKDRSMLSVARNAWEDGQRAASYINNDERVVARRLIRSGHLKLKSEGLWRGRKEIYAWITPKGFDALDNPPPRKKAMAKKPAKEKKLSLRQTILAYLPGPANKAARDRIHKQIATFDEGGGAFDSRGDAVRMLGDLIAFSSPYAVEEIAKAAERSPSPTGTRKKKSVAKKKSKSKKLCMMKGYAYELEDCSPWDKCADDHWNIVIHDGGPATVVGRRKIDGADVIVFKRGATYYAQSAINVKDC